MNEPPQLPSAFGIEAVEWEARGEGHVSVRVSGRWRRRRPLATGQTTLVIETGGQRHRFPAMPEPPGITGVAPGTWRLSFTGPASLSPGPGDHVWLQIGGVAVPLPVSLTAEDQAPDGEDRPGPAELKPEEEEVSEADPDPRGRILRTELRLAGARPLARAASPVPGAPVADPALAQERRLVGNPPASASDPRSVPSPSPVSEILRAVADELGELRGLADRERRQRIEADTRAIGLERAVQEANERAQRAYEAIARIRSDLGEAATREESPTQPHSPPVSFDPAPVSPGTSGGAGLDPGRLDAALSRLREERQAPPPAVEAAPVPPPHRPIRPGGWLGPAFSGLSRADPVTGGRLALALLPLQGRVSTEALSYDLVLEGVGIVQVTAPAAGAPVRVTLGDARRTPGEVSFVITGDLAGLARLLAGRLRRWPFHWRRRARVRGSRASAQTLFSLVRAPLALGELTQLEPWLMLSLVARMIDPSLTAGESFTIAFVETSASAAPLLLHVHDGRPIAVLESVPDATATTRLLLPRGSLAAVLQGEPGAVREIDGPTRPLALLQSWIDRAQSG